MNFKNLVICFEQLIFNKLRSCLGHTTYMCACLCAHVLSVNFVSSQQAVTPCRCFLFHGGRCACVIPAKEAVKPGEGTVLSLEGEAEMSEVKTPGQVSAHVAQNTSAVSHVVRG